VWRAAADSDLYFMGEVIQVYTGEVGVMLLFLFCLFHLLGSDRDRPAISGDKDELLTEAEREGWGYWTVGR
jgi:hypothetical protein